MSRYYHKPRNTSFFDPEYTEDIDDEECAEHEEGLDEVDFANERKEDFLREKNQP